jgi:biopolymer transport protein ExbB/TolQ
MEVIQSCLYHVAIVLLPPTLLLLLVLLGWTLVVAGGLARELLERRRMRKALEGAIELVERDRSSLPEAWALLAESPTGLVAEFVSGLDRWPEDELGRAKRIEDLDNAVAASLSRVSAVTRTGPMLGLMGTLIPLGPALTGLAAGDFSALAGDLVVAFTATVVGILIGVAAYLVGVVRRTWYGQDMSDLEYLSRRALGQEVADAPRR